MPISIPKILIVIIIQLIIAAVHGFRLGQSFDGQMYNLYYSYFSDLILPFGMYFLLSLNDTSIPVFRPWYVKAGTIFFLATSAEICQFFGFDVLGVTFDPFDILMYGVGVLMAGFVDVKLFTPNLGFWTTLKNEQLKIIHLVCPYQCIAPDESSGTRNYHDCGWNTPGSPQGGWLRKVLV